MLRLDYATSYHRDFEDSGDEEKIKEHVDRWPPDWLKKLRAGQRKVEQAPEPPESQTITEFIRAHARAILATRFDEFHDQASPEEIRVLSEVLEQWGTEGPHHIMGRDGECTLAAAMGYVLGRGNTRFLKITEKQWDRVRQHILILEEEVE